MTMTEDIVAIAATDCKTLAAAVTAAGLVETLQGKGPFTVLHLRMQLLLQFNQRWTNY